MLLAKLRTRLGLRKGRGGEMVPERLQDAHGILLSKPESMRCLLDHCHSVAQVKDHYDKQWMAGRRQAAAQSERRTRCNSSPSRLRQ